MSEKVIWVADADARKASNFAKFACLIRDQAKDGWPIVAKAYGDTRAEAEGWAAMIADAVNARKEGRAK